jgi:hypothetical protein
MIEAAERTPVRRAGRVAAPLLVVGLLLLSVPAGAANSDIQAEVRRAQAQLAVLSHQLDGIEAHLGAGVHEAGQEERKLQQFLFAFEQFYKSSSHLVGQIDKLQGRAPTHERLPALTHAPTLGAQLTSDIAFLRSLLAISTHQQASLAVAIQSGASKPPRAEIGQTSDAVTQQTNMATALIQELSTLLQVIFR